MAFDSTSHFWNTVSGSDEAQARTASLVHGKVASATWWPFLSHAESEADFDNRLSVVAGRIEASVDPEVYDDVISSLRDDFRAVHEASRLNGQSSSPELSGINDGLHSHKADLTNMEIFDHSAGRWVTATKSEPGLGCPHCKWTGYSSKDRTAHIEDKHPGKDSGDSADIEFAKSRKKATNYQPDPHADWRYHYPNLNGPVDNGALMDSDGFVKDLAQGEDRSQPVIEQRQLTPGTWTQHDGMPERPMPQGVQRGYQPVAKREDHPANAHGAYDWGTKHAREGTKLDLPTQPAQRAAYIDGYNNGNKPGENAPYQGQHSAPDYAGRHAASLLVDADGFLVTAYEGRGVDGLADPAPGATQRVNPYYFNTEDAAMGSNAGFPESPSQGNEGQPNRASQIYGETAPVMSSGSEQGTVDGKGYSRSNPGESPNFSERTAASTRDHKPVGGDTPWEHGLLHGRMGYVPDPRGVPDDGRADYYAGHRQGLSEGRVGQFDYMNHEQAHSAPMNRTSNKHVPGYNSWEDEPPIKDHEWEDPDFVVNRAFSHGVRGDEPEHPQDEGYMIGYHGGRDSKWGPKQSATDGKFVKKCPGCKEPLRSHTTPHGDELRHAHNNSVRCFDKTSAVDHPITTVTHPAADPAHRTDENYHADCEECGHLTSHPDYDAVHAVATDHQNQHWVKNHDDKFGQGSHENDFGWLYQGKLQMHSSWGKKEEPNEDRRLKTSDAYRAGHTVGQDHVARGVEYDESQAMRNDHGLQQSLRYTVNPNRMTSDYLTGYSHGYHGAPGIALDAGRKPQFFDPTLTVTADYLGRPDANNPTGRGPDEYRAERWDAYRTTRPMQDAEDRKINTPVMPQEHLRSRQVNTPTPGLKESPGERGDDEAEDGDD